MLELMKVVIIVSIVLAIVMGGERLFLLLARKLNINRKTLLNAGIAVLLIAASISGIFLVLKNRVEE
jgi:hypothetical protein